MLIDTHAHLDFTEYQENFDLLLDNIKLSGVEKVIIPGVEIKDIGRIIDLTEKYDDLYGAVGLHPCDAQIWNDDSYNTLKKYAQNPKIVAIGETGLDFYRDKSNIEGQKFVFQQHINLAKELDKPLIIHNRTADEETLDILKKNNVSKAVMHCFSSSLEIAQECIKMGLYIAIGGVITFKNAKILKEVAASIPLENLLLETDSPFLAPHPYRGERNDPSKLKLIAEEIAKLRDISFEEVARVTTDNAKNLFKF